MASVAEEVELEPLSFEEDEGHDYAAEDWDEREAREYRDQEREQLSNYYADLGI